MSNQTPDFMQITRPDTIGSITATNLLPNAGHFIATYGHLLAPGESIHLNELADRINQHSDNPDCTQEADSLRLWVSLMVHATHLADADYELPDCFEHNGMSYNSRECEAILGDRAMIYIIEHTAPSRSELDEIGEPVMETVTLTLNQVNELLEAASTVSWNNLDFRGAVLALRAARNDMTA